MASNAGVSEAANRWDSEVAGSRLMERVLNGVARRHDADKKQQAHDYDIELPDGAVIAVEITQHVPSHAIETDNLIVNRNWQFTCLERDWFVDVVAGAHVGTLHAELAQLLSQLEDGGIDQQAFTHAEARAAGAGLAALGVLSCRSYPPEDPVGRIHVHQETETQWIGDANSILEVVPLVAERKAATLGNTHAATERHLLTWVDAASLSERFAMETGRLPMRIPTLPDKVDTVWLALSIHQPILWRVDRTGWTDLGRIDDATMTVRP